MSSPRNKTFNGWKGSSAMSHKRSSTTSRLATLAIALTTAVALAGCTAPQEAEANADSPVKVRYLIATPVPGAGQATYTSLPQALGLWEDEGLDVEVGVFEGSTAVVSALAAGQTDITITSPQALMRSHSDGSTDIIGFYTSVTKEFEQPAVLADSKIRTLLDLQGKKIGVSSLDSNRVAVLPAMVDAAGGDGSTLEFLPVGLGAEAAAALTAGHVDAINLWDDRYAEIKGLGIDIRLLDTGSDDEFGFRVAVQAKASWLEENKETATKFARAIARASVFATENPEAAVLLHWEVYPDSKPVGVADDEALAKATAALKARLANSQPVDGMWGLSTPEQVEYHVNLLKSIGVIKDGVHPSAVWTGDLITDINDFDAGAMKDQARNFKR